MPNILYDYFRSSCAYRIRIALHLKQIPFQATSISLLKHEQYQSTYLKLNPTGGVPTWQDENITLSQSLAILEYLDEAYPQTPKIIPQDIIQRAKARQLAMIIACDIHPLNNLRVKEYLHWDEKDFMTWYHHWLKQGFEGFESSLQHSYPFCLGENLSIADICLIPQIYNALRFNFDLKPYPKILAINEYCEKIPAFIAAYPQEKT
jgi:maleylacetoacetate isomerase